MVNDVTDWLSQTTDISKYFVWSPGLWDKESPLYIYGQQEQVTVRNHNRSISMGCEEWKFVQMFQVTWPCPYMVKSSKIFFFGTKRLMTLKLGIQHQVLEYYHCFHMMTLVWPWPFLWQGQIFFRMLLHGWKLIQHWVLLYFQGSDSAYPQHSV